MPRKSSIGKIDMDRIKEQKELWRQLESHLHRFLIETNRDSSCNYLFIKLIPFLYPMPENDDGALTLGGTGLQLRTKRTLTKPHYLLHISYYTMRQWQRYLRKELSGGRMRHLINYLSYISVNNLDSYEVVGNIKTGYRLKVKR